MHAGEGKRRTTTSNAAGAAPLTLCIDIGGSGIKAIVCDRGGRTIGDRVRTETPVGESPADLVQDIADLVADLCRADRIGVGFPGVVHGGRVRTAANLGHRSWIGFDLAAAMSAEFGLPARVANDADVQGLAVIEGRGIEMVATLGTGFGTGLYRDGELAPHLELAHHPFRNDETYEQQLGDAARRAVGKRKWNRRVIKAVDQLRRLVCFDRLYLGGGNAKKLHLDLPADVEVTANKAGLIGCVALWEGAAAVRT